MYKCPNCGKKSRGEFCAECGSKTVFIPKKYKKAGPIVRLTLAALCAVAIVALFVAISLLMGQLPRFNEWLAIIGTAGMVTASLVCTILLAVYTVPPMFRVANKFCSGLVSLSVFGFFIKIMLWITITLFPFGVGTYLLGGLLTVASLLLNDPNNYLALFGFAGIGVVTMAASLIPDVVRLVRAFTAKPYISQGK